MGRKDLDPHGRFRGEWVKLSNVNSNCALTLSYLNPALNNLAQVLLTCCVRPCKSLGSITSRCSGKWARTHPPKIKTRKSSSGRIKDRTRETAEIEPTKSHVTLDSKGAFRSTKTFENQETRANGREISRKCFQKFGKLLNFRIIYQPKILEILGATKKLNGTKTSGKKFPKIWVHPARLSYF